MLIIGCDFHTRYQQIAMLDDQSGELIERRLEHPNGQAHKFYRDLPKPVRVGVEATGPLLFTQNGRAELASLALGPWASRRREELARLLDQLDPAIDELDRAVTQEAKRRVAHPWVPSPDR